MSVWARLPKPRLAAWTPDGALLVSLPTTGQVVATGAETGRASRIRVLLDGLDQPHGLRFAGYTFYVAESDQVDAYEYADGHGHRTARRRRRTCPTPEARIWAAPTRTH